MLEEIIIAGFGGQGVLVLGEILATAGMLDGKYVAWMPEYGPETRGGTANCTVIVSDEEIGSTVVDAPSCIIIMNQPSLEKFLPKVLKNGLAIVNSSLVSIKPGKQKTAVIEINANAIAQDIGNPKAANLVMLGAYIAKFGAIRAEMALEAIEEWSKHNEKEDFLEANKKALMAGIQQASKKRGK